MCDMDSCPGSRGFFRGAGETADIREGSTDHGLREPVRFKVRMETGSRQWWLCGEHQWARLRLISAVVVQSSALHGSFAGS